MWMFYFLLWTAVRANEEPLYRKIGDTVVLTPDSVVNPITNIRWKHGPNIAMQWNGDETISYRQFKDRGSLDILTGVMTITGLTRNDSGIYTAEINGKETNSQTELLVISPVPKPTLSVSCVPEMTYCVFTCSGNIAEPAPVTYWWTAGEKMWNSTSQHKITKEEKEQWFSCRVENPVSSNISEEVFNPFITYRTWIEIMPKVVGVFLVVCIILIICLICRYIKERAANRTPKGDAADGKGQGFKPQWQYAGERRGEWCDFRETTDPLNERSVTSDDVEKWYHENSHVKRSFTMNEDVYELDFTARTLTHLMTKTKRKVRRVMLPPECQDVGVFLL